MIGSFVGQAGRRARLEKLAEGLRSQEVRGGPPPSGPPRGDHHFPTRDVVPGHVRRVIKVPAWAIDDKPFPSTPLRPLPPRDVARRARPHQITQRFVHRPHPGLRHHYGRRVAVHVHALRAEAADAGAESCCTHVLDEALDAFEERRRLFALAERSATPSVYRSLSRSAPCRASDLPVA